MASLFPLHGIELKYGEALDPRNLFGEDRKDREVLLDIGFGLGDSLLHFAQARASTSNCLGIELLRSGIAQCLEKIQNLDIQNAKIIRCDVLLLLKQNLVDDCIDETTILFPDPWPSDERDAERRVVRTETLDLLERKLKEGGRLRIVTDVHDYYSYVLALMKKREGFHLRASSISQPGERGPHILLEWPPTKYELRAAELQHSIYYLEYTTTKKRT